MSTACKYLQRPIFSSLFPPHKYLQHAGASIYGARVLLRARRR